MKRIATLTMVNIGQAKGVLDVGAGGEIHSFREKDDSDGAVINGGFMVCEPGIFDYIEGDDTVLEQDPFRKLCSDRELVGYYHKGFWQCMDTAARKEKVRKSSGKAATRPGSDGEEKLACLKIRRNRRRDRKFSRW